MEEPCSPEARKARSSFGTWRGGECLGPANYQARTCSHCGKIWLATMLSVPAGQSARSLQRPGRHCRCSADTSEPRKVLERMAKGTPEARVTREAKASVERLVKRPAAWP